MAAPGQETGQSGAARSRPDWASFFHLGLVLSGSLTLGRVPMTQKTSHSGGAFKKDVISQQKVIHEGVTPTKAESSAANKWEEPVKENTFPHNCDNQ